MYINNHDIINAYVGPRHILRICLGSKVVWESITELLSCFANGYWMDEYPWTDDVGWTD